MGREELTSVPVHIFSTGRGSGRGDNASYSHRDCVLFSALLNGFHTSHINSAFLALGVNNLGVQIQPRNGQKVLRGLLFTCIP